MSSPITCFPAFMEISEIEQAVEVEGFLAERGGQSAPHSEDGEDKPLERLIRIVDQCHVVFRGNSENDSEGLFYGIVSLLHIVPADQVQVLLDSFCKQLTTSANHENGRIILRLFSLMLVHMPEQDKRGLTIFTSQLSLAASLKLCTQLQLTSEAVAHRIACWGLSDEEKHQLYLTLWKTYQETSNSLANQFLVEGLRLCSPTDAPQLAGQAQQLVVSVLQDPGSFVMDYLLELEPVNALRGELIYKLLEIFVSGSYSDYMAFWDQNQSFCSSHDLCHTSCQHKMRLLTMMSLSNETNELSFELLQKQLELQPGEIEGFIVDAVKMGLIQAKINQVSRLIIVVGGTARYRTFGTDMWHVMRNRLLVWQTNIGSVHSSLKALGMQQTA